MRVLQRAWRGLFVEQSVAGAIPWLVGSRILGLVLAFVTSVLIARALGPYGKGITNAVMLVSLFVVAITNLGIGQGVFFYQSRKEFAPSESFTALTAVGLLATALCLLLGLGPLRALLRVVAGEVPWPYLAIGLLLGGLSLVGVFYSDLLRGLGLAHLASVVSVTAQFLVAIAVVVVLIAGGGLQGIVGTLVLSSLLMIGLSLLAFGRLDTFGLKLSPHMLSKSFRFGRSLYLNGLVLLVHTRFNQMLVLALLNPAALGQLGVAVALAEMLWLIDLPLIGAAQYHVASRSQEASIALVNQMTRLIAAAQLCACTCLALIGSVLVVTAYGEAFRAAVLPLLLSLPGILFWSVGRSVSQYIGFQLARNDINLYIQLVSAALNVTASLVLIRRWGIGGAALAASVSYGLAMLLFLAYYVRTTGVRLRDVLVVRVSDLRAVAVPQWQRVMALFGASGN